MKYTFLILQIGWNLAFGNYTLDYAVCLEMLNSLQIVQYLETCY